jgi:hypothetical protein
MVNGKILLAIKPRIPELQPVNMEPGLTRWHSLHKNRQPCNAYFFSTLSGSS